MSFFCVLGFSLEPLHFSLIYEIFPSNRSPIGGTLKARFGNTLVSPYLVKFLMTYNIIKLGFYRNQSQKVQFCAFQTIQTTILMEDPIDLDLIKIRTAHFLF